MGDRTSFMRSEREVPRNERDRERDLRNERERDRDIRSERERDRDRERERHDQQPMFSRQFQSDLPPRFQKQQAERHQHQFLRVGSGGSSSSPQPLPGTGSASQGAPSAQVSPASQGAPATQMFDTRWTGPSTHYSGSLQSKNSSILRPIHNENVSINTTLTHDINATFEEIAFTMKSLTQETGLMPSSG